MCVSALGINVRLCFGFTAPKAAAAEATKIAAKALRARQLYFVPSHELHKYTHWPYHVFHNYICRMDFFALLMNNFEHRVLRIEPTAVQRCARKSTEFESR